MDRASPTGSMDHKGYPMLINSANVDDMNRIPPAHCTKVFLQRDYSEGTFVRFQSKFPQEIDGKIDRSSFENTMTQLNNMYSEAESLSGKTYCESCFACMTAYMAYLCMQTGYEKAMKKISRFIRSQNEEIYAPRGLLIIDPIDRGLRCVEICILNDASPR